MTHDEIIGMARLAGLPSSDLYHENLEAFAKLVADKATEKANARSNASWTLMCKKMVEAEREACAQVCDDIDLECESEDVLATWCAESIRARGQE